MHIILVCSAQNVRLSKQIGNYSQDRAGENGTNPKSRAESFDVWPIYFRHTNRCGLLCLGEIENLVTCQHSVAAVSYGIDISRIGIERAAVLLKELPASQGKTTVLPVTAGLCC